MDEGGLNKGSVLFFVSKEGGFHNYYSENRVLINPGVRSGEVNLTN